MSLEAQHERLLEGATVVVTRAADDAVELVELLEASGAIALLAPVIAFEPPVDGGNALAGILDEADAGDVVAVTSRRGADALLAACPDGPRSGVVVAAVGEATAAALSESGWRADLVPAVQTAVALAAELGSAPQRGRVIYVAAAVPRPDLANLLREQGWQVDQVEAYRTQLIGLPQDVVVEASKADLITFTSGSTVHGWLDAAAGAATPVVVTLGPPTTKTATEQGLKVSAEATEHTVSGLVEAVVRVWVATPRRH